MADTPGLQVTPAATRLILQGGREAREAIASRWGVSLPEEACRALKSGSRASLWLGPDEHLLYDSTGADPRIAELEAALAPHAHSLVDVSHRQVGLTVAGHNAELLLNGACPLDLDLAAFPVDMCTRTVFAKAEVILWRTAPQSFQLEVWRSFQGYVEGLLKEIGREFSSAA